MEYSSQIRIESKACPGVAFTVLRMTWRRRLELQTRQAKSRERLAELNEQAAPLSREYSAAATRAKALVQPERDRLIAAGASAEAAAKSVPLGEIDFAADKLKQLMEWNEQIDFVSQAELVPQAVGFGLVGIEGLTIDGQPATFELLKECGPDELYEEISAAIARELGLLPAEKANLGSPSTSAAAVDGSEAIGSAADAWKLVSITKEAVPSSTVPESVSALATP